MPVRIIRQSVGLIARRPTGPRRKLPVSKNANARPLDGKKPRQRTIADTTYGCPQKETALIRSAILIISALCFALSLPASAEAFTKEQWNRRYGGLKARPLLRHDRITSCISEFEDAVSEDTRKEIESMNTVPASEVIAEVCARFINAIADGRLTYELYKEWTVDPTGDWIKHLQ